MTQVLSPSRPAALQAPSPARRQAWLEALDTCRAKCRRTLPALIEARRSGAFSADGDYFTLAEDFFDIGNWTSSFFTGMALLDVELGGDRAELQQLERLASSYREKATERRADTMHDLGFLYTLYSVGLHKLTGDAEHRATALLAADELARRFVPNGRYIRAWGRRDDPSSEYTGLAIIDCLMNLPLLFWAARESGDTAYRDVALAHADSTLACFVRPDDTVYHAYRYDPVTGAPARPDNYCGHHVESVWARGSSWAIYGFALAYRHSGDLRYLGASRRLALRFVDQLGEGIVPLWDFRLDAGMPQLLDTSAGAVACCGLQELLDSHPNNAVLADAVDALLDALCTLHVNHDPACLGVLREAEIGDGRLPEDPSRLRARNAYTSWGDYFLMEALARRLHGLKSHW